MYADFIEDRLAQNSEYIKLLKQGIEIFKPIWMDDNFREKIKYDNFSLIDSFFSNVKAEYNDTEKLFLYHSIYSQAGFEEALENLSFFITGLKVEVKKENVSYRPMIEWNYNEDEYDPTFTYDYGHANAFDFYFLTEGTYTENPINVSSPIPTEYNCEINYLDSKENIKIESNLTFKADINQTNYNYVLFDNNPYIDAIIPEGSYVSVKNTNNNQVVDTITIPITITDTTILGNYSVVKLEADETTSSIIGSPVWRLLIPNSYNQIAISYNFHQPLKLKILRHNSARLETNIAIIKPDINNNTTIGELFAHATLLSNGSYIFDFNPYLKITNNLLIPENRTNEIYSYTIYVSTATELFYDTDLAKSQINELVRELLFYYKNETPELNIKFLTFDNNVVNNRYNDLIISARKYYYLTL